MSLPIANVIKNVAERVIYGEGGATTEQILRGVVSELFDNDLFIDAASKSISDIIAILESDFELGDNGLWQIRAGRQVGNFVPIRNRIRYCVIGYLRKVGKATFDDIVTTILPLLINGHRPTREDIDGVLKEVAVSHNGKSWELRDPSQIGIQAILPLLDEAAPSEIPASTTHNQHIYRLAILCQKAGLVPYIGKQERNDPLLAGLKPLTTLNTKADPGLQKRIEQIDIVWATADASPIWAFEVEEHTSILSALERFAALLSSEPALGHQRRLTIVVPKSRRRKLHQELTTSTYVGHPLYLESKVSYLFFDDLEMGFAKFSSRSMFRLEELYTLCRLPQPANDR